MDGTAIESVDWNAVLTDLSAALTQSVSKDGQTTMTGNLPMNSHKITGLSDGTAATDAANLGQVAAASYQFATAGGTADAITLTVSPAITSYAAGQEFWFVAGGTNTTTVTVAVSGLTTKAVQANSAVLVAGDIVSGRLYGIKYDGTQFQLLSSKAAKLHTADIADSAITATQLGAGAATLAKLDTTGTAGQVLLATAAASAPVWASGFSRRNIIDNGDFMVDQRVNLLTSVADAVYCIDRWYVLTQTASIQISQQSAQETSQHYNIRLTQNQVAAQRMGIAQICVGTGDINNANSLYVAGKTCVLSARIRCSSSQAIRYAIIQNNWAGGKDVVGTWTSGTYTAGNFFTTDAIPLGVGSITPAANTWTDITAITGTFASTASSVPIVFFWTEGTAAQNVTLDIGLVQLEIGATPTSFEYINFFDQWTHCQAFYAKSFFYTTAPAQNISSGKGEYRFPQVVGASTAKKGDYIRFPRAMYQPNGPTITLYNPEAANAQARNLTAGSDCTLTTAVNPSHLGFSLEFTSPAGTTAGQAIAIHWTAVAEP